MYAAATDGESKNILNISGNPTISRLRTDAFNM